MHGLHLGEPRGQVAVPCDLHANQRRPSVVSEGLSLWAIGTPSAKMRRSVSYFRPSSPGSARRAPASYRPNRRARARLGLKRSRSPM
jgi:hypothetical protein